MMVGSQVLKTERIMPCMLVDSVAVEVVAFSVAAGTGEVGGIVEDAEEFVAVEVEVGAAEDDEVVEEVYFFAEKDVTHEHEQGLFAFAFGGVDAALEIDDGFAGVLRLAGGGDAGTSQDDDGAVAVEVAGEGVEDVDVGALPF